MKLKDCGTQNNEAAALKRENIQKICGWMYALSTIIVIVWAILGVMMILEDIWASLDLPTETVSLWSGWHPVEAKLLSFEGTRVFIPILNTGWIPAGLNNVFLTTLFNVLVIAVFIALMLYVRSIFNDISNGGSPFSRKVAIATYGIALLMFFNALQSGKLDFQFIMIISSALVALLGFIFDYGRILQEERDTML